MDVVQRAPTARLYLPMLVCQYALAHALFALSHTLYALAHALFALSHTLYALAHPHIVGACVTVGSRARHIAPMPGSS